MANKDDIFKKRSNVESSIAMHKEVQKELVAVLCSSKMNVDDIETWQQKLVQFQEAYSKILYSELSAFILDEKKDDIIKLIQDNLNNISDKMNKDYLTATLNQDNYLFWLKYKDHCELAILQRKHYHISIGEIEDKSKTVALDSVKNETDRIQKDLTSQLIGLISIFTALSFVIFGGINILSSVLENVKLASITRMIAAGCLWTICMSLLFFIFVRFILKIMRPNEKTTFSKQFMISFWSIIVILICVISCVIFLDVKFYNPPYLGDKITEKVVYPETIIVHDNGLDFVDEQN